jgi:hypothetical protein
VEGVHTDELTEIRQEVFKLFQIINKKGVTADPNAKGSEDADWKTITGYTQDDWNKRKALEAPWDKWRNYKAEVLNYKAYLKAMEYFDKGIIKKKPKEVKEPEVVERPKGDEITKLTTCILVQTKVLAKAATNLKLKYDTASLMDPKQMDQSLAWTWAAPGMPQRPKAGDIFVLISLGEKLGKAKTALTQAQNQSPAMLKQLHTTRDNAQKELDSWLKKSADQAAVLDTLEKDKTMNPHTRRGQIAQSKTLIEAWRGPISIWRKNLKEAQQRLDAALTAKERAEAMLAEARSGEQFRTQLFFSHVGFFVNREPFAADPTKELWKTFDGGQTFTEGKATKQGAKFVERVYDPDTNEIWAKPHQAGQIESQDGQTRWFLGWYDLDKLVREKTEK